MAYLVRAEKILDIVHREEVSNQGSKEAFKFFFYNIYIFKKATITSRSPLCGDSLPWYCGPVVFLHLLICIIPHHSEYYTLHYTGELGAVQTLACFTVLRPLCRICYRSNLTVQNFVTALHFSYTFIVKHIVTVQTYRT